jgi:hypothetical protein
MYDAFSPSLLTLSLIEGGENVRWCCWKSTAMEWEIDVFVMDYRVSFL